MPWQLDGCLGLRLPYREAGDRTLGVSRSLLRHYNKSYFDDYAFQRNNFSLVALVPRSDIAPAISEPTFCIILAHAQHVNRPKSFDHLSRSGVPRGPQGTEVPASGDGILHSAGSTERNRASSSSFAESDRSITTRFPKSILGVY